MQEQQQAFAAPRSRVPNWMLAAGLFGFSAFTYFYVMQRVGPNLNDQLEAEAARQEAAERKSRGK
jgi:hypothetical protein